MLKAEEETIFRDELILRFNISRKKNKGILRFNFKIYSLVVSQLK
jgi:hypothetical protein